MCRNIKNLFNFEPPATDEEIQAAALQFVRKVSGFHKPSQPNELSFNRSVNETATIIHRLLSDLVTQAEPHNREIEAAKAHARSLHRFGKA